MSRDFKVYRGRRSRAFLRLKTLGILDAPEFGMGNRALFRDSEGKLIQLRTSGLTESHGVPAWNLSLDNPFPESDLMIVLLQEEKVRFVLRFNPDQIAKYSPKKRQVSAASFSSSEFFSHLVYEE